MAFISLAFGLYYYKPRENKSENNLVFILIILYSAYQVFYIGPIFYTQFHWTFNTIFGLLFYRLYFLLILFFYFAVLPVFKDPYTPLKWIVYSSLALLILFLYNYSKGIYSMTETGQMRVAPGNVAFIFIVPMIYSFKFLSGEKNKLGLFLSAFIGFVLANHRSAYLGIALVFIASFISINRLKNKLNILITSGFLFIVIFIILSQTPVFYQTFIGRVSSSTNIQDPNVKIRFKGWTLAWDNFKQNPANGSMIPGKYYKYDIWKIYPHNFMLEILSTEGIIGFIPIMSILIIILIIGYKNRTDLISFQMFLVVIFYLFFSYTNGLFLYDQNILILCFASAMILYRNNNLNKLTENDININFNENVAVINE